MVLRLEPRRHIRFSEDTIDNEHMKKKSSKRCCIFKKQRDFGESSSESDCDCEPRANKTRPTGNTPGAGWTQRVPDYQRFHA